MATPAPIKGNTRLIAGQTTTLTDATAGGVWSSSDPAIATVSGVGLVTAITCGECAIIYTIGLDSIATSFVVTSKALSNGLEIDSVYDALKDRVKWRSEGSVSESNRYFEDFHTLCDTNILKELQPTISPTGEAFTEYLENLKRSVIMEAINAIYCKPQLIDANKLCFFRIDRLYLQPVVNAGQFVGIQINLSQGDFVTHLTQLLLLFDKTCTFTMYLYDDMLTAPIYSKEVTAQGGQQSLVDLRNDVVLRNLTDSDINGGIKYFGYYQDDIAAQGAQALYFNLNYNRFKPCRVMAFGAPVVTDINGKRNFNRFTIGANNLMYGLNAKISTYRDGTNNIIQNAQLFDELIGLLMAAKNIEAIIYSYRSNGTQRIVQDNAQLIHLYEELNLARPTEEIPFSVGLRKKVERETLRVKKSFQNKQTLQVGTV